MSNTCLIETCVRITSQIRCQNPSKSIRTEVVNIKKDPLPGIDPPSSNPRSDHSRRSTLQLALRPCGLGLTHEFVTACKDVNDSPASTCLTMLSLTHVPMLPTISSLSFRGKREVPIFLSPFSPPFLKSPVTHRLLHTHYNILSLSIHPC